MVFIKLQGSGRAWKILYACVADIGAVYFTYTELPDQGQQIASGYRTNSVCSRDLQTRINSCIMKNGAGHEMDAGGKWETTNQFGVAYNKGRGTTRIWMVTRCTVKQVRHEHELLPVFHQR